MKKPKGLPYTPNYRLALFNRRYEAILEACANRVWALARRGQKYTTITELAEYVVANLPTYYREAFGTETGDPTGRRALKVWRVRLMLSNASFLGAFHALDLKACPGRGVRTLLWREDVKSARPQSEETQARKRAAA